MNTGIKNKEIQEDDWDLFDFTNVEEKVLLALLEHGLIAVSKLGRVADLPRTTVYSALLRIKDRGFVRRVTKGHSKKWKIVRSSKLKELMGGGFRGFDRESIHATQNEIIGGIDAKEIGIAVYRGKRQIQKAYENMLDLGKAGRVIAVQGNKSADIVLKRLGKQYLLDFHKKFKKAHIIMVAINGEHVLNVLKNLSKTELMSHLDRMLIGTVLPDKYMDYGLDMLIFRDTVLIIDTEKELVVFIKNQPIVDMLRSFCMFFQDNGRHVNFNREIWKIIEEKKRA